MLRLVRLVQIWQKVRPWKKCTNVRSFGQCESMMQCSDGERAQSADLVDEKLWSNRLSITAVFSSSVNTVSNPI